MYGASLSPAGGLEGERRVCATEGGPSICPTLHPARQTHSPKRLENTCAVRRKKAGIAVSLNYPHRLKGRIIAATRHRLHYTRKTCARRAKATEEDSNSFHASVRPTAARHAVGPISCGHIDLWIERPLLEQRLWPPSLVRVVGGPWCGLAQPIGLEV